MLKIGFFHWNFEYVGGGEVLAKNIGEALNIPVHSIISGENPFNFIDITKNLSFITKKIRNIRTLDYFTWSTVDVSKFGDFDLILSSGSTPRALVVPDHIPHVNICFSTPRWLYDLYHYRLNKIRGIFKTPIIPFAEFMRMLDSSVDNRVDYYITISPIIKRRLYKYMKRDSDIIYPPIDVLKYEHYDNIGEVNYYLFLSRLEPEKRPEEVIKACIMENEKLIVAGTGTLEKYLRNKYRSNKNIEFKGFITESQKISLLSTCKALIYPAIDEDFGIVPIEALASGKPVICANGGYPPTLIKNKYGMITDGTSKDIAWSIRNIPEFNKDDLINCAKQFDLSIFKESLRERLNFYYDDFNEKYNK